MEKLKQFLWKKLRNDVKPKAIFNGRNWEMMENLRQFLMKEIERRWWKT